ARRARRRPAPPGLAPPAAGASRAPASVRAAPANGQGNRSNQPLTATAQARGTSLPSMAKAGPRSSQDADDVKARLIDATVRVLARDGFAHASARSIAAEAGGANALIFYHFGSMDGLLSATVDALAERGIARVKEGLGGDRS